MNRELAGQFKSRVILEDNNRTIIDQIFDDLNNEAYRWFMNFEPGTYEILSYAQVIDSGYQTMVLRGLHTGNLSRSEITHFLNWLLTELVSNSYTGLHTEDPEIVRQTKGWLDWEYRSSNSYWEVALL